MATPPYERRARRQQPSGPAKLGSLVAFAVVLVGILVFLFIKSQTGEISRQNEITASLRQLKEIDARWNVILAAFRGGALESLPPSGIVSDGLRRHLDTLAQQTTGLGKDQLMSWSGELRATFEEKARLMAAFEAGSKNVLNARRGVVTALDGAREQSGGGGLAQEVDITFGALSLFMHDPSGGPAARLEGAAATLLSRAAGAPVQVRGALSQLAAPVQIILKEQPGVVELIRQIVFLPTSPRLDAISGAFDREFQALAEQKELFRIYLAAYSAALLVFLGYVGWQLRASYRQLNEVNAALVMSNDTLEQRVKERTRELTEAMTHLKDSESMLIQTEKMSSLGQMVAGIAHEINTPLAYVKSSLESIETRMPEVGALVAACESLIAMLDRGDASDEDLSQQFQQVSQRAHAFRQQHATEEMTTMLTDGLHGIGQIAEIVANLKNFSRLDRSKVSRFNVNEGLESTLVIARNLLKNKRVVKQFAELPMIECSPSQINQVFLNLITNAAQATEGRAGEITLVTQMADAAHVRVDVADNGHGIAADVLPKIFDPFFTTKDVGKGTGLGLSIAYKIVHEHGGRLEVSSKVGVGSKFSVTLPVRTATSKLAIAA